MTAGLLLAAAITILPSSVHADAPASLQPIYDMTAPAVAAVDAKGVECPACLDAIYRLCECKDDASGKAGDSGSCHCDPGVECDCGGCSCGKGDKESTRTIAKPTMKLSREAQARHDRRMAKLELPADDPPPRPELKDEPPKPLAMGDAAPTPITEIARVINWMPKPEIGFVDFGCGSEARWCIAAAEKWKCRVTGVEIDADRAKAAREHVRNLGLDGLITIVHGNALTTDVQGDVAAVYLYPEVLEKMKPRLEKFRVVASYQHLVPGLPMVKSGDSWFYTQSSSQSVQVQTGQRQAVWQGMVYTAPVCNSANCTMCNTLRYQLYGQ